MVDSTNSVFASAGLRTYEDTNQAVGRSQGDLGQEDFLDLMVAQLRNQDPMKPMDNGDFLGQMAQFGTVSGIDELQKSFESFSSSISSGQALQAANLIGHQVLAETDVGSLAEGGTIEGIISIPSSSPSVSVSVYNEAGQVVRQVDLGSRSSGDVTFSWDGTDNNGNAMPAGSYRISAEALYEGNSEALAVSASSLVSSVTLNPNGGLSIGLDSGDTLEFSQIKQIL